MRSTFIFLLILTLTLTCVSHVIAKKHHHDGPDDAICTQFSGLNSTCSSCILQGCSYCDITGTGHSGLCLSHKTAHTTCNRTTTLISSFASLTQCRVKQHDVYESLSAFIPIIITILTSISVILLAYYILPSYATPTKTTLSPPSLPNPHWYARITHLFRSNGIIYRIIMIGIFITVFVLAIVTIGAQMWSIQIDGHVDKHHRSNSWDSATSAIAYNTWGLHTITRNPSDHDDLIFRSSSYQCNNVNDDNFIRCSLHRVIASGAGVVAVMALICLCIVAIQIIISLLCCRSLSNYSVKYMSLAAILHLSAVMMYAAAFLLQSRVASDSNSIKAMDATSSAPYRLFLGVSWNCCLAAAIINAFALIPMTRGHIKSIEAPIKGRCCWRRRARSNSEISISGQVQDDTHVPAQMGVVVATPITTASAPYVPPVASTRYIYGVNNIQTTDQDISTHTNMYPTVATPVMMTTQNGYQAI